VSNRERRKGRDAEAEVRRLVVAHNLIVQAFGGREDQPDSLLLLSGRKPIALETKRQETARVWAWWEQATANAAGMTPVVAFRRSRSEWLAIVRLEDLLELLE
jgi:hypothetical protein